MIPDWSPEYLGESWVNLNVSDENDNAPFFKVYLVY